MPKRAGQPFCYRYRTRALVGPWQPTLGAAWDDAIRAGQPRADPDGTIQWAIKSEIEARLPAIGQVIAVPDGQPS